ncbi:protein asteroid homolog 1-like isoform X1 [Sebastes umbrosus]|uniref:protein asteroid homolog 1-like isoform X1 n=1 Tax=Sebastes umbrosus TaxID=72105 RepID=UPI0018A02392|nr:protein asteroid homolog 1-like isoform X1 [Sebastes umbrosus]
MGVQSLTSLLENHRRIYRDVQFRRSRLVVDGCNLLYLLYFSSGLDQNHGGEYAAFEVLIEKFIKALRDCGIVPHVVLDGGSDYTDKKLQTKMLRAVSRIKKAHRAAEGNSQEGILPQLVGLVFKQTLARLEVPVAQCYWEADQEIAALAREWRCPVLSNDSDFYIFDLPAGLLPISDFKWEAVEQSGSQSYIPCKSYNTSSFCIFFDIQRQLLPAFAALAGNDYVKLQKMTSPINWAQFAPEGKGVETTGRLEGLLCWLKAFQRPQEALEAALGLMGDLSRKTKEEVLKGLYLGMKEYQLPPSSLKRFFIHGTAPPLPAVEQKVTDLVPDWIRLPLTQARLTADILDVLLLRRMSLSYPVDHADMPSAHLTSRPLRQVMYGLMLGDQPEVEERDRDGLELRFIPVRPAITDATQQLTLSSLDQAEPSQRLLVLLGALGVTEDSLSCLPSQLRLPVAATCYWLQRAQPPPDQEVVKALLLGLSTGDALRHTAALQIQRHRQKLDAVVNHALNQWQSCLKVSIQLNQLLGLPLPEPHIARLYEGTLVHQLILGMRSGGKQRHFVKRDRSGVKQYQTMQAVVHQFHTREAPAPAPSETQERTAAPQHNPLDDLTAILQQLFLPDEDAELEASSSVRVEEDLDLNHLVSVKSRYRAKERKNRCKNPELARKQECRGWDLL